MANAINTNNTQDPNGVYWTATATLDTLTASLPDAETICATGTICKPFGISMGVTAGTATALDLSLTNGAGVEFARVGATVGGPPTYVPFDTSTVNGIILNPIANAASAGTPTTVVTVYYKYVSGTAPTVV